MSRVSVSHTFSREIEDLVYNVLTGNGSFKFKLQVLDCRKNLSRKFDNYVRERTRVKLAISRLDNVMEEVLQR